MDKVCSSKRSCVCEHIQRCVIVLCWPWNLNGVQIKRRLLEFLAVRQLAPRESGTAILCLVGAPGVGKTSLGKSVLF